MHDVWYLEVETVINGARRGFSLQILAREDRTRTVPAIVQARGEEFLGKVLDGSDVYAYDAVTAGERCDFPYRFGSYRLSRNGEEVIRSFTARPLRPEVMTIN